MIMLGSLHRKSVKVKSDRRKTIGQIIPESLRRVE